MKIEVRPDKQLLIANKFSAVTALMLVYKYINMSGYRINITRLCGGH